jgi:hypothetical protein
MIFQNLLSFILAIMSTTPPTPWSSQYSDWYNRTSPLPSDTPIPKSNLLFAVTYDAFGGSGFNLALFKPDIAVTSTGEIRKVQADDFAGFTNLTIEASTLPNPENNSGIGGKRRFRVHHKYSCRTFTILSILKVPEAGEPVLDVTSVYSFSKDTRRLERSAGNLPDVLWELLGLVDEAPSHNDDAKVDDTVLKRIREMKTEL